MIFRRRLFDAVRARFGALSQAQVDGINAIIDVWEARGLTDPRWLAYILATAWHETGRTMQPVREIGRGNGRAYGIPDQKTGRVYYGRGLVQITWKTNYERLGKRLGLDLVNNPDRALEPAISARILVIGMEEGLFTGKRLADYFSDGAASWVNARRIVNGLDRAEMIAAYARKFHDAISSAEVAVAPAPSPSPAPVPSPPAPAAPVAPASFWRRFWSALTKRIAA
mgnify:CR=1 FL=1